MQNKKWILLKTDPKAASKIRRLQGSSAQPKTAACWTSVFNQRIAPTASIVVEGVSNCEGPKFLNFNFYKQNEAP